MGPPLELPVPGRVRQGRRAAEGSSSVQQQPSSDRRDSASTGREGCAAIRPAQP
eukprot:CAMPEP_0179230782 /NCGR_PEP_ID=MMETSP0797-20121207/11008_1 /TAXON_ID=47934 /ORGANISM="Dinophysis acuminata, Strain DAEP01" /LENGTH=53 /DNA_ID=CAMNT_0020937855 /DNA_START=518 /DNA_END=676 /DNA_ORIENTATION=-